MPNCKSDHRELAKSDSFTFCPVCGIPLEKATDPNADYVTTLACVNPHRAIVAVMHFSKADDSYQLKKCSDPLSQRGAAELAESWAKALGVEVR